MSINQGGVVSQGSIQRELVPGINAIIDTERQKPMTYAQIYDVEKSERAYEEFVIRSGTSLLQLKPQGAAIQYDSYSEVGMVRMVMSTTPSALQLPKKRWMTTCTWMKAPKALCCWLVPRK